MKPPFELFIGFTGCGYTYCNKAIEHDGNYKKLAFVDAYTGKKSPGIRNRKESPAMCFFGLNMIPTQ